MLCLQDYEEYAKKHLNHQTLAFYCQGAEREETLKENLRAFTRYLLVPRMLLNTPHRDLTTTILGHKVKLPIGIAPTGFQKLAHPDGEIAAVKAAADMGIVYTLSTVANSSLEDVSRAVPRDSLLWMQVYVLKNKQYTEKMIRRAEDCGYKALVLTVDTPVTGLQLRVWRSRLKLPPHLNAPNVDEALGEDSGKTGNYEHVNNTKKYFCDTLTWEDISWIKRISKLPLILKGILTAEDARKAVEYGVAGVWVSNHGGRQLDGVDAAIDCLPAIASALEGTGCEVYVDGGVRWGSDVLKALALGARMVFIGRPCLWGLAHSGQEGVRNIIQILRDELDRAMHLSGCKNIQDIRPNLVKKIEFSKM